MAIYEPKVYIKDPQAVIDITFDWKAETNGTALDGETDWLGASEMITTGTITVPAGITKDSSSRTDTNTSVTVWLSGGTAGADYEVECKIVTDNSTARTDVRTVTVKVRER